MNGSSPNGKDRQKCQKNVGLPSYETAKFVPCGPRFQRLRSSVQQLCNGQLSALYVCGFPGTFQLMTIKHELTRLKQKYVERCAPLSVVQLVQLLQNNPEKHILIKRSSLLYLYPDVVKLILRLVKKNFATPVIPNKLPDEICPMPQFTGSIIFVSDHIFGEDRMAQVFDGEEFLKVHCPSVLEICECCKEWAQTIVNVKPRKRGQDVALVLNLHRVLYICKEKARELLAIRKVLRANMQDRSQKRLAELRNVESQRLEVTRQIELINASLKRLDSSHFEIRS